MAKSIEVLLWEHAVALAISVRDGEEREKMHLVITAMMAITPAKEALRILQTWNSLHWRTLMKTWGVRHGVRVDL